MTLAVTPGLNRAVRWAVLSVFVSGLALQAIFGNAPDGSAFILISFGAYVCFGNLIAARQPTNRSDGSS